MEDNNLIVPGFDSERDKELRITLEKNPEIENVLNVYIKGRIDNYSTPFFQSRLDKIFNAGYSRVLFKCSELEYVSSTGFGVFATYFKKAKEMDGTFVFSKIQPKVMEIFQLLGFDSFFPIDNDVYPLKNFFISEKKSVQNVFPKLVSCPICNSKLRATKAGKFRCAKCKVILKIDQDGVVTIV